MVTPTLKQQKTFAAIRIVGGLVAAFVLGYSFVVNIFGGLPMEGAVLMTGIMAFLGLAYAAYYTRVLGRIAKSERSGDA